MSVRFWAILVAGVMAFTILGIGCSGGDPAAPGNDQTALIIPKAKEAEAAPRQLLGYWNCIYDIETHEITALPARTTQLHLNVRDILEHPGPLIDLSIKNLDDKLLPVVTVDVGLHHPFAALTEFTGFDVRGIFISRGNWSGWADSTIRIPRRNEPRLTNADGYTRWWNPTEFDGTTNWFNYSDGLLGCPHSWANFNSILNGYKLFADDLTENSPLNSLQPANRAVFSPGKWNWRHYRIDFGKLQSNWIIFNYAVDASWEIPSPSATPPYDLSDFPIENNSPEAYRVRVTETNNTLDFNGYTGSGDLGLDIDVFDWQNPGEITAIQVESLDLWSGPNFALAVPGSGGPTYSTYHIDIAGCTPTFAGVTDVLISVPCDEWNYEPSLTQWSGTSQYGAYQLYQVIIAGSNCPPYAKVNNNGWRVDTAPGNNAVANRNGIWSDGTKVYVVWYDSSSGVMDIYFNVSLNGGVTWPVNQLRLTDDLADNDIQKLPQMAVTPDGQRICVVWDDQRYADLPVDPDIDEPMYTISDDGGLTWCANKSAKLKPIPNYKQFQPTVCCDDNGAFYIAYIDEDVGSSPGQDKTCCVAKIPAGSTNVSINKIVGDKVGNNYFGAQDWKLDIAYFNSTIYVMWADPRNKYTGNNTSVDVFLDKSTDGGNTWGTDMKVNPDNTNTDQYDPCFMIGDSGVLYAAYIDEQSGTAQLAYVKSLTGGATWSYYKKIGSLPGIHQYPDMARGGLENIFLVWEISDTSYISWSCDEGDTWEDPVIIDPVEAPDEVETPCVYVGQNNFVFVAASHRLTGIAPRYIICWRFE